MPSFALGRVRRLRRCFLTCEIPEIGLIIVMAVKLAVRDGRLHVRKIVRALGRRWRGKRHDAAKQRHQRKEFSGHHWKRGILSIMARCNA